MGGCFFLVSRLQVVLWPLLLKMLVVEKYTGAVSTVYILSILSRQSIQSLFYIILICIWKLRFYPNCDIGVGSLSWLIFLSQFTREGLLALNTFCCCGNSSMTVVILTYLHFLARCVDAFQSSLGGNLHVEKAYL